MVESEILNFYHYIEKLYLTDFSPASVPKSTLHVRSHQKRKTTPDILDLGMVSIAQGP